MFLLILPPRARNQQRSVVMGIIISWGNINGAATTNVYREQDKPWYTLGHGMIILYLVIGEPFYFQEED